MGKERREVRVHLFKGGQQALAAFLVQAGDTGAQFLDRLFQVGLFGGERVVFRLDRLGVFLGAQVHGAQGLALAF